MIGRRLVESGVVESGRLGLRISQMCRVVASVRALVNHAFQSESLVRRTLLTMLEVAVVIARYEGSQGRRPVDRKLKRHGG